jgi:hypothetical protein
MCSSLWERKDDGHPLAASTGLAGRQSTSLMVSSRSEGFPRALQWRPPW